MDKPQPGSICTKPQTAQFTTYREQSAQLDIYPRHFPKGRESASSQRSAVILVHRQDIDFQLLVFLNHFRGWLICVRHGI